jgi:hypothetical protein
MLKDEIKKKINEKKDKKNLSQLGLTHQTRNLGHKIKITP